MCHLAGRPELFLALSREQGAAAEPWQSHPEQQNVPEDAHTPDNTATSQSTGEELSWKCKNSS